MAQKRMFSLQIVDTDAFLEMPISSQLLYFHLAMRADDEGFIGNPKKIMRLVGVQEDDYKILVAKRFLLIFESGVVVIKHWLIHNTIRMDRFNQTTYQDEKNRITTKENRAYTELATIRQPNDNQLATQVKLSKVKLSKVNIDTTATLKQKFFSNPLMEKIKNQYPNRNYDFQFDLMADWWIKRKNKLPQNISAFASWLENTKPEIINNLDKYKNL